MVAAKAHNLSGSAIRHMEEVAARWLHYHPEGDYWHRAINQPVELGSGEKGALIQAVDNIAAHLNVRVHDRLQSGGLFTCIRQHSCLPLVGDG